ncbi:reverse transcriptase domain-containing protein [Tanacetum coccineum]
MGVENLQANVDSKLVANQVNGSYIAKESGMVQYLNKVKTLAKAFKDFPIKTNTRSVKQESGCPEQDRVPQACASYKQHAFGLGCSCKVIHTGYYWADNAYGCIGLDMEVQMTVKYTVLSQENPQQNLTPITSPWPFYKIEAGRATITDNGKQFRDNPFKDWCEKLCIRQCFASVKHPQANGLVERANRSLGEGIKARLDEKSKYWIEELQLVRLGPTV